MTRGTLVKAGEADLEEVRNRVRTKDSPQQFDVSYSAYTFPINGNDSLTWGQWAAGVYYTQVCLTVFGPLGPWSVPGFGAEITVSFDGGNTFQTGDKHPGIGYNKTLAAGPNYTPDHIGVNITNWPSGAPEHYGRLFFQLTD